MIRKSQKYDSDLDQETPRAILCLLVWRYVNKRKHPSSSPRIPIYYIADKLNLPPSYIKDACIELGDMVLHKEGRTPYVELSPNYYHLCQSRQGSRKIG